MPVLEQLGADALRHTLVTYRNTLKRHQADLNKLNVYPVPDGDTGSNMARTLDAVVAELDKHPDSLDETYNAISHGSLMGARGNSGVILSQILRGLSATLKVASEHGAVKVAEALKAASVAAYDSVLKPIEGTILTVVREAADAGAALALLDERIAQLKEPRDRFHALLVQAELLAQEGMEALARQHYQHLWQEASRLGLSHWEPGLVSRLESQATPLSK